MVFATCSARAARNVARSRLAATSRFEPPSRSPRSSSAPRRGRRVSRGPQDGDTPLPPALRPPGPIGWSCRPPSPPSSVMKRPQWENCPAQNDGSPSRSRTSTTPPSRAQANRAGGTSDPAISGTSRCGNTFASHRQTCPACHPLATGAVRGESKETLTEAFCRQFSRPSSRSRHGPATRGTVRCVPSQTGTCSTASSALNSVTSSKLKNAQSISRSASSARLVHRGHAVQNQDNPPAVAL